MKDVDTRGELAEFLKENCVLRQLLVSTKPCVHFGPSKSCVDCLFGWEVVAQKSLNLISARRASYEKEQAKVKILSGKVRVAENTLQQVFSLLIQVGDGAQALSALAELAKKSTEKVEKADDEQSKNSG